MLSGIGIAFLKTIGMIGVALPLARVTTQIMLIKTNSFEFEFAGSLLYLKTPTMEVSLKPAGNPRSDRRGIPRIQLPRVVEHPDGFSWDGLGFELEYCRLGPRRLLRPRA